MRIKCRHWQWLWWYLRYSYGTWRCLQISESRKYFKYKLFFYFSDNTYIFSLLSSADVDGPAKSLPGSQAEISCASSRLPRLSRGNCSIWTMSCLRWSITEGERICQSTSRLSQVVTSCKHVWSSSTFWTVVWLLLRTCGNRSIYCSESRKLIVYWIRSVAIVRIILRIDCYVPSISKNLFGPDFRSSRINSWR